MLYELTTSNEYFSDVVFIEANSETHAEEIAKKWFEPHELAEDYQLSQYADCYYLAECTLGKLMQSSHGRAYTTPLLRLDGTILWFYNSEFKDKIHPLELCELSPNYLRFVRNEYAKVTSNFGNGKIIVNFSIIGDSQVSVWIYKEHGGIYIDFIGNKYEGYEGNYDKLFMLDAQITSVTSELNKETENNTLKSTVTMHTDHGNLSIFFSRPKTEYGNNIILSINI